MTRDQKLIAAFAALAVLAVGAVGGGIALQDPPPTQAVARDLPAGTDGRVSLQFLGDTLLGDEVQNQIDQRGIGYDWPFDAIRPSLSADFVMAVAEGPISDRTEQWNRAKRYSYSSRPEAAGALARAGVDAVQLANNHAFDVGPEGLDDTIRLLDSAGIAAVGAGPNLARAEQPLLLRTEIGTIGIVAVGESFGHRATDDAPGTLVMDTNSIHRGAALARAAGADWVIGFPHWGGNYEPVDRDQRSFAQTFAEAGYDLVLGSGPHSSQNIEYIGSMPVIYSIGNFVFGTPGRWATNGVPARGLSVDLELGGPQQARLSVRCMVTDNLVVDFQPRLCSSDEAAEFLPTLHPDLVLQGDVGVLPCPECFAQPPVTAGPGAEDQR